MTDNSAAQLLAASVELYLERNRDALGVCPGATADLRCRAMELGVFERVQDGSVRSAAGGSVEDVIAMIRVQAPHLFRDETVTKAPPAPDPRTLSAAARLDLANGPGPEHEAARLLGHRRRGQ
jgi:hypothetical protein